MEGIIGYLIVINIIGIITMKRDKKRAKQNKWRIPEKRIWLISLLGGSLGTIFGMNYYRHKTNHIQFRIGLPLLFVAQMIGLTWIYR
ncbi:DUF1294 domain-containing protein [Amphibacillus cookii]|uniref:DUF1294 domain-containing protein n=1 Tax=Amphibacillus cookii TaxID=767787 RepID=UPI0019594435|nr:DUF1294 domain-containing protein [Amphibacillus cookii]MBM7541877.1 uncharacterized membrane protein YsdA (DUF1294 family) [Amphibacillus cookii]